MNSTFFITGVTSGIGSEILKLADAKQWNITAVVRNHNQKNILRKKYPQIQILVCDLSNPTEVQHLCTQISSCSFDYALLNAGIARGGTLLELDAVTIDEQIQVNLLSVIHITKALLHNPHNSKMKLGFVSSLSARWICTNHVSYGASKAGITSFYKSLQSEHPSNPMVCFEIGGVDTGIHAKAGMTELDTDSFASQQEIGKKMFHALQHKTGVRTLKTSWYFQRKILMIFEDTILYFTHFFHGS